LVIDDLWKGEEVLLRRNFPSDSYYYLRGKPFTAAAAQENFPLSLSLGAAL
jgi:hypothetical protein